MKKAILLTVAVGLVLACCMIAFSAPQASADKGKDVYAAQKCSVCHSIAGVGNPKHPLDGVGAKLTEDLIKKWIKTPKEMKKDTTMKAYTTLSDADTANLVAYLLSLKK